MTHAGNQRLPALRALAVLGMGLVWAAACGGPEKQAGAGAVCFRFDDCKDGLACVPQSADSSKRICSADLRLIVSMVDGAPPKPATTAQPDATTGGSASSAPTGGADAAGALDVPTAGTAGGGAPAGGGGAAVSGGGS